MSSLLTDEPYETFGGPIYDTETEVVEEIKEVTGDVGQTLVLCWNFLTPPITTTVGYAKIFSQSTCTIGDKVCHFVIDSGSYKNVVAEDVVKKLGLEPEKHPKPYKLA